MIFINRGFYFNQPRGFQTTEETWISSEYIITYLSPINMKVSCNPGKGNTNEPCEKKVNVLNSSSPTHGSPIVTQGPSIEVDACIKAPLGFQLVQPDVSM